MNTNKFLQTDGRWGGLGYPQKPWYIRNCGCGEVSIANILIEMKQYANYTPATIQPYCKQYSAPNGDGTYWSGIPAMMKHYGLTEVKEHATMTPLWNELAKGNRVAIYLMGSKKGGSKGVHWTSGGHFVCSVGYKYENGKHYVYVKDSYSDSSLRNKWISYEENMRGDILKVWSGKLNGQANTATPATTSDGKLTVDGIGGTATVKAMQKYFKTVQDGVISGQTKSYKNYYPALTAVSFGKGGSTLVIALQKWLGLSQPDGIIGKNTTKAWQTKLRSLGYLAKNETIDGIIGVKTMKAWQKFLNDNYGKTAPAPTPAPAKTIQDKIIDACVTQANWMKNFTYKWESKPTIEKSKKKGTCVTYVACVLQRVGLEPSGDYIWHNGKGYGTGKVTGNTSKFNVTYMGNKTFTQLKDKLQKGDVVLCDDNKSGEKGSGGHIMIFSGKWASNGNPYVYDQNSATYAKQGKSLLRSYSKSHKILAICRAK
ncbi:MAG: C39 family peptidase [Lachnospiraceae bacterium]|nr:C39 family peptidase [Lachnospiraceae bacterium]